jgi:two-component system NtrC family sensor kinase
MKKILLALILLLLTLVSKTFSQAPVVFNGNTVIIGKSVSILEDPSNTLRLSDVIASTKFIPSQTQTPNLQLSKSGFWLKFSARNKSSSAALMLALEYPTLSVCDFYYPADGGYRVDQLSDETPFTQRKYQHQDFVFDIRLPKDSTAIYYLNVRSSEEMVLPLILATPQKLAESFLANNILWGIFMGLILVMVLYNFFIFLFTRDVSYLYYVLYSTFIGLTQTTLSGYTYQYLFANSPGLLHKCIIVFPALAGITAMLFVRSFLYTKVRTPWLHHFFLLPILSYSVAIVFRLAGFDQVSYRMIDFSALLTTALIYLVAVRISLQGYRPAKLFLIAWTIFFAGIILFTLRNLGVLPYNNFTNYTMESGIAFEVTLLSLALADKINILKDEREAFQLASLEAARENERIIQEQNVVLEVKVKERTLALIATLDDLRSAQARLVESEKMASLGQLTAGIAHEINNPINFVTSNVSPLQRDVAMVFDAVAAIESIGLSASPLAEKQRQINEYKEELYFDYLKMEIQQLLTGIYDGASRTAEIVKGLQVFSRLDEGDLKIADINDGIDSSLVILNNQLGNIMLVKHYGDLPPVECYPGKLNQVFLNILSNAIYATNKKYGLDTGGRITITTSISAYSVIISIKDNGIGMDAGTQTKVFDPFFTTKDVGEGTGLGMSISYSTIKKHSGELLVNSSPGNGAEFIIQIPVKQGAKP